MKKNSEALTNLNKLDEKSLVKELHSSVKEFGKYNLVKSVGKENNSAKYRILKNKIARINTVLSKVKNEK